MAEIHTQPMINSPLMFLGLQDILFLHLGVLSFSVLYLLDTTVAKMVDSWIGLTNNCKILYDCSTVLVSPQFSENINTIIKK